MNKTLLSILACPLCGGSVLYRQKTQALVCTADQIAYPIQNEIFRMRPDNAQTFSDADDQNEE